MLIEDRMEGDTLVVKLLETRLDAHVAVSFKDKMAEYIDAGHTNIILNLGATEFIDSSGLGSIVSALKRQGAKGSFILCELQDTTMSMFKLTRMDKVFSIHDTEQAALDASVPA